VSHRTARRKARRFPGRATADGATPVVGSFRHDLLLGHRRAGLAAAPTATLLRGRPSGNPGHTGRGPLATPRPAGEDECRSVLSARNGAAGTLNSMARSPTMCRCRKPTWCRSRTSTPTIRTDAARMVSPGILYPYHFGQTDTSRLAPLLKDRPDIEIRVRRMPRDPVPRGAVSAAVHGTQRLPGTAPGDVEDLPKALNRRPLPSSPCVPSVARAGS
jgi:hypothetical protein